MGYRESKSQLRKDWQDLKTVLKEDCQHWKEIVQEYQIKLKLVPEFTKDWNSLQNNLAIASVYLITAEHYLSIIESLEKGNPVEDKIGGKTT